MFRGVVGIIRRKMDYFCNISLDEGGVKEAELIDEQAE